MFRILRVLTTAALAVVLLRLWHLLVLRQLLDRPFAFGAWLALVFVLVLAGRAVARATPAAERGRLDRRWAALDGDDIALLATLLALVFVFHWTYERASSDGREYFVQVRSLVMDRDLDFTNEIQAFGSGTRSALYPIGGPLLWLPFYVACQLWLALLNRFGAAFPLDGYGNPYQMAIGIGSLIYGWLGLVLIYRLLVDFFPRRVAFGSMLAMCCGSFVIWYLVIESSMVHAMSLFSSTLFLYLWYRTRGERTPGQWMAVGAAAGLMAIVRWQDVLFFAVPAIDMAIVSWRAGGARAILRNALLGGACALVVVSPQLLFWKSVRGAWIDAPAKSHGVDLTSSSFMADALFSPNHGLFAWTPLFYLAALGLVVFYRRDRTLFAALAVGLVAQIYVAGTLDVGWGGSGYGARRFADCALVFAVGIASLVEWARRHPATAPALVIGVFVAANTAFMMDVENGRLPTSEGITFESMFGSLYRRIGNPFSFPQNALVARKYGVDWTFYDQQLGRTYYNVAVDLGEADDAVFLGPGWSDRERGRDFSFRWATALESTLIVPLKKSGDYQLDLRCGPYTYSGAPPQTVTVIWNGRTVGQQALDKGYAIYAFPVPARVVRPERNEIRLRYAYATPPSSVSSSRDSRPLAVSCDFIRMTWLSGSVD